MFGDGHHDSVVQRGIDEALACQDVLERTPIKPSRVSQLVAGWSRWSARLLTVKPGLSIRLPLRPRPLPDKSGIT
jgi:hypothetical protein